MILDDATGAGTRVELRPLGYEFPVARGDRDDDNWLLVEGTVTAPEGTWTFTDPCLLTHEARAVSEWLWGAAAGRVAASVPGDDGWLSPDTWFTEPVLAFSVAGRTDEGVTVRVHLSLEAAPPGQWADRPGIYRYCVEVTVDGPALMQAAAQWDRALAAFPPR